MLASGNNPTPNELEAGTAGPHDRLLNGYQVEIATDSIDRTHKMALEAEQLGASVLEDLRRQREQIKNAARHVQETDHDLDRSNRILRDMLRRLTELVLFPMIF